jgi:hypothetical protein
MLSSGLGDGDGPLNSFWMTRPDYSTGASNRNLYIYVEEKHILRLEERYI